MTSIRCYSNLLANYTGYESIVITSIQGMFVILATRSLEIGFFCDLHVLARKCANLFGKGFTPFIPVVIETSDKVKVTNHEVLRALLGIITTGATTAAVTEKVLGEYVSLVCQILTKRAKEFKIYFI